MIRQEFFNHFIEIVEKWPSWKSSIEPSLLVIVHVLEKFDINYQRCNSSLITIHLFLPQLLGSVWKEHRRLRVSGLFVLILGKKCSTLLIEILFIAGLIIVCKASRPTVFTLTGWNYGLFARNDSSIVSTTVDIFRSKYAGRRKHNFSIRITKNIGFNPHHRIGNVGYLF